MHEHERGPSAGAGTASEPVRPPEVDLRQRVRSAAPGLESLVATAEAAQRERAEAAEADHPLVRGAPRWTDVFTTQFTEFSNRPR